MLAAMVLLPGVSGGFVFDDLPNIVENAALAVPFTEWSHWWEAALSSSASEIGRPLAMLSFAANAAATGLDPVWFKLTNIGLHGLNGALLYWLMRVLFRSAAISENFRRARIDANLAALAVALVWVVLPIHVSAVLIVVQRMEILAQSFVLLGLVSYVLGRERMIAGQAWGFLWVLVGLFVLPAIGVLAKESAALTPGYAFALEVWLYRFAAASPTARRGLIGLHVVGLAAAAMLALLLLLRYLDPNHWAHRDFTMSERLMTQSRVLWDYLRWILVPDIRAMSLYHDDYPVSRSLLHPASTLMTLFGWCLAVGALAWSARRRSLAALGLAWFLCAHLLTATFIPLELVFEHRNYFASIGVLLCILALLARCARVPVFRRWLVPTVVLLALANAGLTLTRAWEWGAPLRHAQAEAARNPQSMRATYRLGSAYLEAAGDAPGDARFHAAMANFERASRLAGDSSLPLQALIVVSSRNRMPVRGEWWQALAARLRNETATPASIGALHSIVQCQLSRRCSFDDRELIGLLLAGVYRQPADVDALTIYAQYAHFRLGDGELALRLMREAVAAEPRNPLRWYQLGQGLAVERRFDAALEAAQEMDRLDSWRRHRGKSVALRKLIADLQATGVK